MLTYSEQRFAPSSPASLPFYSPLRSEVSMRFRFVHASDIHLGYQQYNLEARADDFTRAYIEGVVAHALQVTADFVLIAGDLFHKANTDAWTLRAAMAGLENLRAAGIPVIAIEGNHDAQHYHRHLSWMQFLCDQELLVLLDADRNGDYFSLPPFDCQSRRGAWIDVAGARIYGIKYYGAALPRLLDLVAGDVQPGPHGYTIMMLHAGLEGQVPHMHGGLTMGQLQPFRSMVDYIGLGHVHKSVTVDDWVFNPGSTEVNSMEEMEWRHGFFDVQVDTEESEKHLVTYISTPTLRAFRRISVLADDCRTLDEFVALVEDRVARTQDIPPNAVVELSLAGVGGFKRQDVPLDRLQAAVETRFAPLTVRVRNNLAPPGTVRISSREALSRAELERRVVEHLVYQNGEYQDAAGAWTRLTLDVKNMAAEGTQPAEIADHVRAALRRLDTVVPPPLDPEPAVAQEAQPEPDHQLHFEDW